MFSKLLFLLTVSLYNVGSYLIAGDTCAYTFKVNYYYGGMLIISSNYKH